MRVIYSILLIALFTGNARAQDELPLQFTDSVSGCNIWDVHHAPASTVRWSGTCVKGSASGKGVLSWYQDGKVTETYTGTMKDGRPEGLGDYKLLNGIRLKGNFRKGILLDLDPAYLLQLHRHVMSTTDTAQNYIHDEGQQNLYYDALIPAKVKGVLVLLNGTWETTEHNISSNKQLCQLALDQGIAVIVPSINQRLVLNSSIISVLDTCFRDAIQRYHLPADRFVLGGFSMGGLFSLRYTAMAYEDSSSVAVKPRAVFSVDGPVDMISIYQKWQRDLENPRNQNKYEPTYGMREMEQYLGGTPLTVREQYIRYSVYTHGEADGGTARYLLQVPLRIYNDVDVNWWISNRGTDLYGMNALDQSAMINFLNGAGNDKAEFINAYGKGYRLEGFRHPHSWSIVDPKECISWVLGILNFE